LLCSGSGPTGGRLAPCSPLKVIRKTCLAVFVDHQEKINHLRPCARSNREKCAFEKTTGYHVQLATGATDASDANTNRCGSISFAIADAPVLSPPPPRRWDPGPPRQAVRAQVLTHSGALLVTEPTEILYISALAFVCERGRSKGVLRSRAFPRPFQQSEGRAPPIMQSITRITHAITNKKIRT
jgi:hypothetical protein